MKALNPAREHQDSQLQSRRVTAMPKKQLELIGEQVPRWMWGGPAGFNAQMSNTGEASGRAVADEGAR